MYATSRLYRKRDGIGQTPCSYERYLVVHIKHFSVTSGSFASMLLVDMIHYWQRIYVSLY